MGTDLQESSVYWFKLTNEILMKGNILCEVPCKNLMWLMTVLFPRHFTSDMGKAQGTNNTPLPPSNIRKERCPGCKVDFITKYKLSYWKLSIIKNHILTWKQNIFKWKKLLKVTNIESKNYHGQTFIIKTDFYNNTCLAINKNTPFWTQ